MVERFAQTEEPCISADEMLLVRIGYKTLLVLRCALQEDEHIDKDEMMFVERCAQKKEQCISADETLLVRIGYKMLLVWRCGPQEKEHIEKR